MELEEIKKLVEETLEREQKARDELDAVAQVNDNMRNLVPANQIIDDLKHIVEKCSEHVMRNEIIHLLDDVLINLVSKRQHFKIQCKDREQWVAISNSGLSCDYHNPYWRCRDGETNPKELTFNYLPKSYSSDKFEDYKKILKHSTKICNLIHKKDKKDIVKQCSKFLKNYTEGDLLIKEYKIDEQEIDYIMYDYNYRKFEWKVKTVKFDSFSITEYEDGLKIVLKYYNKSVCSEYVNFYRNRTIPYLISELLTIPQIEKTIKGYIKEFKERKAEKVKMLDNLKEGLAPYLVLGMLK